MKPKVGYVQYLARAAHFAAQSSANVSVCTTDDFTKSVDSVVYYIDPACPTCNITDGGDMMCVFLSLATGNIQGS